MSQDRIYATPRHCVGDFVFDEQVVEVFPDMISRSVPGYASVLAMTGELAARYAREGTNLYDLGCSLGAAALRMRDPIPADCTIYAVDSSAAMLEKLTQTLSGEADRGDRAVIQPQLADVRDVVCENASFVTLNYTLQFLPVAARQSLLESIFQGMCRHGALVLSEKIHFADPRQDALMVELHHEFKRANGYSDLEIAQKRTALENTLVTETLDIHLTRLQQVGFGSVSVWFQCFNFVSILAVK